MAKGTRGTILKELGQADKALDEVLEHLIAVGRLFDKPGYETYAEFTQALGLMAMTLQGKIQEFEKRV